MSKTDEILTRRVAKVLPDADKLEALMQKKKIRVYLGADPTGGKLHIGHAIGMKKLMEFAEAGHEAILLFGTGTVLVGDPSERDTGRKLITQEEIEENIKTWKDQVSKVIDFDKVTIKQNGDWITKMTLRDIINIGSNISATQLFKRDSFTRRIEAGDPVWFHETMYPLLQGYDSVEMDVDLEIGGTDQEFNMLIGRELQRKMNDREKYVVTVPMINGTDGRQMSKSSGNCIWLDDSAEEMFGKVMSMPDEAMLEYYMYCTDVSHDELKDIEHQLAVGENLRELKSRLAREITAIYHGIKGAQEAEQNFTDRFQKGALPYEIEEFATTLGNRDVIDLLVDSGLAASKSEARRTFEQGGVKLNQEVLSEQSVDIAEGDVLQSGKRNFRKIISA